MARLQLGGVTLTLGAEEEDEAAIEGGGEKAIVEVEGVEEEAIVEVGEGDMVVVQTRCLRTTRSLCRGSPPTAGRRTSSSFLAPSELSRLIRKPAD